MSAIRISEYFGLTGDQLAFEFVDVAVDSDCPLFVDPRAFRHLPSDWGAECVSLLQTFFDCVLTHIQQGDHAGARQLLGSLSEPNETHLGLSKGVPAGRGMGKGLAEHMWDALRASDAATTGLLQDLEDTVLFIEGIGHDRVSDITTNIVRGPLIEFTQDAAQFYGIELVDGAYTARCWNPSRQEWEHLVADVPIVNAAPLLLVPKCLLRRRPTFDAGEYIDQYVFPVLQDEQLQAGGALVDVLKDGSRRVTKKSIEEQFGRSKRLAREVTHRKPETLDRYRSESRFRRRPPSHDELAATLEIDPPDWDALLSAVLDTPTGPVDADRYHRAVQALLSALLYPDLVNPTREYEIHDGRKRIDITFTNENAPGFFTWASDKIVQSPYVFVECKNYGREIANPEIDQLAGRFSSRRGQLGILCCRDFRNRALWDRRCKDTAADDRGFILTLSDADLERLVAERRSDEFHGMFDLLQNQIAALLS